MISTVLSIILFIIFSALGSIHIYWLFGGKWALKNVTPTKGDQTSTLSIPRFATLIVALILLLFGLLYIVKSRLIHIQIPDLIIKYVYWIIPTIFILRAIGDFKYVGLFKKIKHTEFAQADSKRFVPLCITIGIIGVLIQAYK